MENDILKLVQSVLERGYLLSLATIDEGGVWVCDVIYVCDENLNVYWLSRVDARHSRSILKNQNVAGTITISNNPGEKNEGVQLEGAVRKVEGDILAVATKHRLKRGKPAPAKAGEILEEGESWYCLQPTKIELIYESRFGFEKKKLDL